MRTEMAPTYTVSLYMAGDVDVARQAIREYCYDVGLCVTVTPTTYIYTGGEEAGFIVGFINYPRFPVEPADLDATAREVADLLLDRCCQHSYTLVAPEGSTWVTRREVSV